MLNEVSSCIRHILSDNNFYVAVERIGLNIIFPQEIACISGSCHKRISEFSTGRMLAHRGLSYLEQPLQPIMKGELHQPEWPANIIGSISHDNDICAVVMALKDKTEINSVGIDLLSVSCSSYKLSKSEQEAIGSEDELTWISGMAKTDNPELLLLGIKEAAIKAISHCVGDYIDYRSLKLLVSDNSSITYRDITYPASIQFKQCGPYIVSVVTLR